MGPAVVDVIRCTAVFINMQAALACRDLACAVFTGSVSPSGDCRGTVHIMRAAVRDIIAFATILEWMTACSACGGDACFFYTVAGVPSLNRYCAF